MANCFMCGTVIPVGQEFTDAKNYTFCPRCAPQYAKNATATTAPPVAMTAPPPIAPPKPATIMSSDQVKALALDVLAEAPKSVPVKQTHFTPETTNFGFALLLGTIASIVSALIWYGIVVATNMQFSFIAIAIGFIIAFALRYGAGDYDHIGIKLMGAGLVLLTMMTSEFYIVRHFINQQLGDAIPGIVTPDVFFTLIGIGIKGSPLTLLFWGVAVWMVFRFLKGM